MAYRPNFRSIVNGDIVGSSNPFRYIRTSGDVNWQDDDTMILNDFDFQPWNKSGEVQFIVKPDWDVRFRLRTENYGGFGQRILDELGSNGVQAYNVEITNPVLPTGRWKSSMEFTLRGDGMLGVWVDGADVSDTWGTGSFEDEVEHRLGDRSNPTVRNNGFFISFTHPFGDYDDSSTYTLKINEMNDDVLVEIIAVAERTNVPTRPVDDDSEQGNVTSATDVLENGVYYNFSSGQDPDTGFTWNVQLLNYRNSWWVVSNGELVNFYSTRQAAEEAAARYVENARRRQEGADPDPTPDINPVPIAVGAGLVGIAVLLAVVFVASR